MSSLLQQSLRINFYLQPILFVLTITANAVNIRILSSRMLRLSPCTHYFLGYAILSIFYTCLACPTQILRSYSIDWAHQPIGCKAHFYLLFLIPVQTKVMLLFASFDRYYSSSKSRQFNSTSTVKIARMVIILGILVAAVYMSPMLFVYSWDEQSRTCHSKSHPSVHWYALSQILFYYVIAPVLMITFGILTIRNIRKISVRAKLLTSATSRRKTEGQLARMLLLQVGVHLILSLPFGIIYLINTIDSTTRTPTILGIRYILVILQQCDYFVSFFLYTLSASIYREELSRIWRSHSCHQHKYSFQTSNFHRPLMIPHSAHVKMSGIDSAAIHPHGDTL